MHPRVAVQNGLIRRAQLDHVAAVAFVHQRLDHASCRRGLHDRTVRALKTEILGPDRPGNRRAIGNRHLENGIVMDAHGHRREHHRDAVVRERLILQTARLEFNNLRMSRGDEQEYRRVRKASRPHIYMIDWTDLMQNPVSRPSHGELSSYGLRNLRTEYWNLGTSQLIEKAIERGEGALSEGGALVVRTGQFTGRSPKDKYIVREPGTESTVNWGSVNQPMTPEHFDGLFARMLDFWQGQDVFVQDCFAGADEGFQLPVRIVAQRAWHSLFARQLFVRPDSQNPPRDPEFTLFFAPVFHADPAKDGTRSQTAIVINFAKKMVLIAGTEYAGEMKKSVFSILNHLLTFRNVMPMHCSANIGPDGRVALFFGLSGTGKTTMSADPDRRLIG